MDDALSPELLSARVGAARLLREYRVFAELGSTSTYLRERARDEAEGLVVVAEHQTAGRGRQGRAWVAPPRSSIHCSVLLRPPLPPPDLYLLTAACALSVRDAVAPLVTAPARIKWPNDVLLGDRKVCGILAEVSLAQGGRPEVVLGFGVNVHAPPPREIAPNATCVAEHAARPPMRLEVLAAVLRRYDALLGALYEGGTARVYEAWRSSLHTIGKHVQVRAEDGMIEGIALDVARDGGLILQPAGGAPPLTVYAGEAIERASTG